MRDRYLPLVDRVSDREELNRRDRANGRANSPRCIPLLSGATRESRPIKLISPRSAHGFAAMRKPAGTWWSTSTCTIPICPNTAPPLARPESLVSEGEMISASMAESLLGVPDERALLRGKAGIQVMLRVKSAKGETRDVLVTPIIRRRMKQAALRGMGVLAPSEGRSSLRRTRSATSTCAPWDREDIDQWAREYYPVFNRQGLIIDVRHNQGGNIDSWLLGKLLRQAWFYLQPRVGNPTWNMQYAFRGHIVVLCDQETASDGEAFTEGFKRFRMGKVIGTRTWGGEIWLSGSNVRPTAASPPPRRPACTGRKASG